jgi:KipI family sensor histidine kinase inhibitor
MLTRPLGDTALRVQLGERIDEETHARVQSALSALEQAALPGVRELVPAYTTIVVHYDPFAVAAAADQPDLAGWLTRRVEQAIDQARNAKPRRGESVEVPVCYGGEFGPDLARVAEQSGLEPDEVTKRHAAADYWVAMIGFAPGFPYLVGLPGELATPRIARPRKNVPAGSVGIAAAQTGIYPLESPGGWNLIGRTPLRLFDLTRDPPSRLRAGDRVKFRPISPEEFQRLEGRT